MNYVSSSMTLVCSSSLSRLFCSPLPTISEISERFALDQGGSSHHQQQHNSTSNQPATHHHHHVEHTQHRQPPGAGQSGHTTRRRRHSFQVAPLIESWTGSLSWCCRGLEWLTPCVLALPLLVCRQPRPVACACQPTTRSAAPTRDLNSSRAPSQASRSAATP